MSRIFHRIVLTGASSGIGAALARELAAPGVSMLLIARDAARLRAVAEDAALKGAAAEICALDVTDAAEMKAALLAYDAAGPVDLVIANAGVSAGLGPDRAPEDPAAAERVWRVNYLGARNAVDPLIPAMRARRAGHLALVSSLAALSPLADMPSYSASKAALRAYGVSLRRWLRPEGVHVTVLCPGFVTSPMSARHHGAKPFELPAERAAAIMARGLARRRPLVTFPAGLALLSWLGARCPPLLSDWFTRGFAARIEPDGE